MVYEDYTNCSNNPTHRYIDYSIIIHVLLRITSLSLYGFIVYTVFEVPSSVTVSSLPAGIHADKTYNVSQ